MRVKEQSGLTLVRKSFPTLHKPSRQSFPRLGVEDHLPVEVTLASADSDLSLSRGKRDIVCIQASALTNAESRIKQQQRNCPVTDGRASLHRPHEPLLLFGFQCLGRFFGKSSRRTLGRPSPRNR